MTLVSLVSSASTLHQIYKQQAQQVGNDNILEGHKARQFNSNFKISENSKADTAQPQSNIRGHGPDFEIALSNDALLLLAQEETGLEKLTEAQQKELDSLFKQIEQIFEKTGDKELTKEQEKQLEALEKKVDSILGPLEAIEEEDPFEGLSEDAKKQLNSLFDQIDKIFETAGDKPLSKEQEKQLEALEKKVDNILGPIEGEESDPFANLSEQSIKQLDTLFEQIDSIFKKAGNNSLSKEQEKQLELLDKKINSILGE